MWERFFIAIDDWATWSYIRLRRIVGDLWERFELYLMIAAFIVVMTFLINLLSPAHAADVDQDFDSWCLTMIAMELHGRTVDVYGGWLEPCAARGLVMYRPGSTEWAPLLTNEELKTALRLYQRQTDF